MRVLVRFLNGELVEYDEVKHEDDLCALICEAYSLHPTQVEIISSSSSLTSSDDEEDDYDLRVNVFIHQKPRVWLSQFRLVYDMTGEDNDPWSADVMDVYRSCTNESILRRLFMLYPTPDQLPPAVFANPLPCVVDLIRTAPINTLMNRRQVARALSLNPNDDVIDIIYTHDPTVSFRGNSNPRCIPLIWQEIERMERDDPGVVYSEQTWFDVMTIPYATRDLIEYAMAKLEAIDTGLRQIISVSYEYRDDPRCSLVFSVLYDRVINMTNDTNDTNDTNMIDCLRFENGMHHRDFATCLEIVESSSSLDPLEWRERIRRLAVIADSDEIARWFLESSHTNARQLVRRELSKNPHPLLVDFFLSHPHEMDRDSWLENPSPRMIGTREWNEMYGVPSWRHLLQRVHRVQRDERPRMLLSSLIESFSKTNDVELVFDTDVHIQFLNGDRMRVCRSWWSTGVAYACWMSSTRETNIKHLIAQRRHIPVHSIELIRTDRDDKDRDDKDRDDKDRDDKDRDDKEWGRYWNEDEEYGRAIEYVALIHNR